MNESGGEGEPQVKSHSSSEEGGVKYSRNKSHINNISNTEDMYT